MAKNLIIFLILFILIPIVNATPQDNETFNVGTDMVSQGIDGFFTSQANAIIEFADSTSNQTSGAGSMALFNSLGTDYNPFDNPGVLESIKNTSIIFLFLFALFVFSGLAYVVIHAKYPSVGQTIDFTFFDDKPFDVTEYIKSLGTVIVLVMFGFTAVWTIMLISRVIGEMMTVSALDALITSPKSGVILFFMAIAYLLLSIFIAIRVLVVSIITSMLMILFVLWAFHVIRDVINQIFIYYLTMIFLQPILISVAAMGIITIEWVLNIGGSGAMTFVYYLALVIILVLTALTFTLGPITVSKLIRIGTRGHL